MIKNFLLLIGVVLLLASCNEVKEPHIYNGKELTVGVIGSAPEINNKKIKFKEITLNNLKSDINTKNLDGIIIMKEYLKEADDDQYVESYRALTIPVFFMQSTKAHIPFTNEGITYDSLPDVQESYATGYLRTKEDGESVEQTWRYQLKDNKENKDNIQNIYTQIFKTIESVTY